MDKLAFQEEVMIGALSRQVEDGECAACGTLSPMPAAALWLARLTHAPKARVLVAGSAHDWPFDGEWAEFFDFAQQGRLDVFFLSGLQIDGQGSINLMAVGDYARPQVRLPGGAGSAILGYVVKKVILFRTAHERRGLVEKVDIATCPGYTPGLSSAQRPGRVRRLITPRCVFAFEPPRPPLLESLHRGVTLEEVREHTGFAFRTPEAVPETPVLSPEARETLYGPVKEKLAQAYPQFAARL